MDTYTYIHKYTLSHLHDIYVCVCAYFVSVNYSVLSNWMPEYGTIIIGRLPLKNIYIKKYFSFKKYA